MTDLTLESLGLKRHELVRIREEEAADAAE